MYVVDNVSKRVPFKDSELIRISEQSSKLLLSDTWFGDLINQSIDTTFYILNLAYISFTKCKDIHENKRQFLWKKFGIYWQTIDNKLKAIRTYALWGNNLKLHIEAVHEENKRSNVIDEEKCLKFTHLSSWRKETIQVWF